jgi:hypothetical protein
MGLTAGPHLPVTARKRKGGARYWADGREEVGQRGPLRAGERRPTAWEFSRAERKGERKGLGRLKEKG